MKNRDYFFDNAKFILIFLVVLGHMLEGVRGSSVGALYRLIYLFHMPCFIFIMGYFSKSAVKRSTFYKYTYYFKHYTCSGQKNL